jgi:hypothetical protein
MKKGVSRGVMSGSAAGLLLWLPLSLVGQDTGQLVAGFEDLPLSVPPMEAYAGPGGGAYYNGSDGAGGFSTGGVRFGNDYNADWMSWAGWAYSTTSDVETAGFGNQYSAFPGGAADGNVYGVTFAPSVIELPTGYRAPVSLKVANTTYAALSMRDGDMFAKKFGDDPATPDVVETDFPDWYKLIITATGLSIERLESMEIYLADFRGPDEADFIADQWIEVDLTLLYDGFASSGDHVATLEFSLESSDIGDFGMNTPAYIAIDELVLGETPTWGGFDLATGPDAPWINTGDWLGWVAVDGDWGFVRNLERWIYLPAGQSTASTGYWIFIPQ